MNKILHTFFFGFLPFKYKRRTRTILIVLPVLVSAFTLLKFYNSYEAQNEKEIDFIYGKYKSKEYASEDFYTTSIGNERTKSYLINKYGNEEFLNQINQGILQKMTECTRPDEEFTKNEFIDELPKNKALGCIAFAIGKQENISGINNYINEHDFVINGLKIQFHDLTYNKIIPLIGAILLFFILIGITSYMMEPFVVEKNNRGMEKGKNISDYNTKDENKNIKNNTEIENNKVNLSQSIAYNNKNKDQSKFSNYLTFNDEYLSGTKFWLRMLVGWITLAILGLGFYIMLTTTYKRAQSLGFGKVLAITSCIYIPIMNILTFMLIRTDDSEVNLLKSILLNIPFAYFYFKNGRKF